MAKLNLVGQISQIGQTEVFGQNNFRKRELILKTVEEYPNTYIIEFTQDKTDLLDAFAEGENVKIACSLKGRDYTSDEGKYSVFMSLNAWSIEVVKF